MVNRILCNFSFILGLISFLFLGCTKKSTEDLAAAVTIEPLKPLKNIQANPNGVMMQAFYWDVEPRGGWWRIIENKLDSWKTLGVDKIWLPPVSKGMSGGYSMGYDPMDYFDFGEYYQMGTVNTRFGSRVELESLIATAHSKNIKVIADIVLNHNSGGALEYNKFRDKNTYTFFRPASGMFNRDFNDFHPNAIHDHDAEALFFAEQDVCHEQPNVKKWFWQSDSSVAKYYQRIMKFDGWRFDYVKGFDRSVIKAWIAAVGGFSVAEAWDGNADYLKKYVNDTGSGAFDFATFYNLEQALDGNNMELLKTRASLFETLPDKAVTFVTNHDTEKDTNQGNRIGSADNKLLAYAYILTHPGYPCIFYLDYEQQLPQLSLQKLITINKALAVGNLSILYADANYYIAQRAGNDKSPGLVVAINNASAPKTQTVSTKWASATLRDYASNNTQAIQTDKDGNAVIYTPAKSYTVWSLKEF